MNPRAIPYLLVVLAALVGCLPLPPELLTCEEANACETTGSTSGGGVTPTTSSGDQTVTGDDASASSTIPDAETFGATGQSTEPPLIIDGVVIPDYIDDNGVLLVEASTTNAQGSSEPVVSELLVDPAPVDVVVMPGVDPKPVAVGGGDWQAASKSARIYRSRTSGTVAHFRPAIQTAGSPRLLRPRQNSDIASSTVGPATASTLACSGRT